MARKRDYAAEYAARKARGAAKGLTRREAVGQRNRDYAAEYDRKVARDVAAGRRKPPNRSAPRNRQAPTGARLTGSAFYGWPNAADEAETRTVAKLRSDRRVFLYAKVATVEPDHPTLVQEDIDLEALVSDAPAAALELIREIGDIQDYQLFPNGGIRADTLRLDAAAAGGLDALIIREVKGPRVAVGNSPTQNPQNRKGGSPILSQQRRGNGVDPLYFIVSVVVQWSD
jgi:hypothetical protein